MNEQRAFTVVVTACKNCPAVSGLRGAGAYCSRANPVLRFEAYMENYQAITPSCPMWSEAKPIGELK